MVTAFKRKKVLTRPVLKLVQDEPVYVKLLGAMHLGKELKEKGDDKKKEPATLIDVINLVTGEEAQIIASAVIKSVLEDNYPNNTYVGLCFEMTKRARQQGKQYNPIHIEEIEEPKTEETATVKTENASEESVSSSTPPTPPPSGNRRR